MRLQASDYRQLLYLRNDTIRNLLFPNNGGFGLQAVNDAPVADTLMLDFDSIEAALRDMFDILEEYKSAVGPA